MHRLRALFAVAGLAALLVLPRVGRGTVGEQRARLPPPAECTDPVAGVWRSHSYNARSEHWNQFTLEMNRDPDDAARLSGRIVNHSWDGSAQEEWPPPCDGRLRYRVSMDAVGRVDGDDLRFGGVGEWRLDEVLCGVADFGYNLDQFAGAIDPALMEFQSVNNDGGQAINVPTVFRRIQCAADPLEPVDAVAPAFQPTVSVGCLW